MSRHHCLLGPHIEGKVAARGELFRHPLTGAPLVALAGILDALGNILFVFAAHSGRLDIAAILSSLYPAATVGLSVLVLRERVTRIQAVGMLLVLLAIPVISA